jgi:hypothetical protein
MQGAHTNVLSLSMTQQYMADSSALKLLRDIETCFLDVCLLMLSLGGKGWVKTVPNFGTTHFRLFPGDCQTKCTS